jgi:hypothetical protein
MIPDPNVTPSSGLKNLAEQCLMQPRSSLKRRIKSSATYLACLHTVQHGWFAEDETT